MSMQDITGHYAIPLAHPFSDVPPPYGRRRRPFVASRRARQNVFDIYGAHRAPALAPETDSVSRAARSVKAVRATDFGSDNRAWVRPHPLRRRWRLTMMACALFGVACIAATHWFDERQHDVARGDVYEAAISTAPAPVAAVVSAEVARTTGRPVEVATVRAEPAAVGKQVVAAADTASVESQTMNAARGPSASEPVVTAIVPNAAAAETTKLAAISKARRGSTANHAVATLATAVRPAATAATASRDKAARSETSIAHSMPQAVAARANDTPVTAPAPSAAEAVGMTAAEFTHWLAATRETPLSDAGAGRTDLTVTLPSHTRLIAQ